MKLMITGGHVTPAITIIDEIKKSWSQKNVNFVFIGRKYATDKEKNLSFEYQELVRHKIPFISLNAGRITRLITLQNWKNIIKIPLGFIQAFYILFKEKPDVILTFGGYIALPVATAGFCFGVPIYTHEQTIRPGFANRIIGFFSKKIFYSFEESKHYFNPKKIIYSGNPVRRAIFQTNSQSFSIKKNKPIIYITGGSLGSHSINQHVFKILPQLLKKYIIIHQIGNISEYHDYETALVNKHDNYFPIKHIFDRNIGNIYNLSDIVIARAGANTFFELIALKKPAIFIPLPWSAYDEQQKQAEIFKTNRIGEIFNQTSESQLLFTLIEKVMKNKSFYQKNFDKLPNLYVKNASDTIIKEILHA